MKKAILLCSGGMSTTIIMNKLNEINDLGFNFTASGIQGTTWEDTALKNEIVLVSPQIRFQLEEVKKVCEPKGIMVFAIPPLMYTPVKAKELWEKIKEEYQNK